MYNKPKPIVLVIMDGIGVAPPSSGNAVSLAKTPSLDLLWPKYPHTYLHASGQNVGLPHGVDGNSEVGHINLGAGKVVFQELPRIDNAISNGSFFKNKHLISAFNRSVNNKVHIMGLIGTGQVHSSYNHWIALLEMAEKLKANGENVFLHLFTDGRDSKPQGAKDLLERLEVEMKRTKVGSIASLIGRYNAMDRDERWERTEKAYNLSVEGKGTPVLSWEEALKLSYKQNKYDEYLEAYVVAKGGEPIAKVEEGDAVIFLNYRPDRAVQLTKAFEDENFKGFDRKIIKDLFFVGLSNYEQGFPRNIAFPPERISQSVGKVLAENRLKQLRIAESEKFPHVTYFFNGGNQVQYPGEDRIEVPSPRDIPTYDQKPEMSSFLISEVLLNKIKDDYYDVIVVNFAGPDMVAWKLLLKQ